MSGFISAKRRDSGGFVVGVDLGGTKIRAGLVDNQGTIFADRRVPTGHGVVTEQIRDLVHALCADVGLPREEVVATGVGGAGVTSHGDMGFTQAPNLPLLDVHDFSGSLAAALGHQVVLENDVNVAAIGELHYGVGKVCRSFVCMAVGTGIGMGIVIDGRLLRGAHGAAGEIGYLPMGADPLDPANHRRGPLEEVLAGDRLVLRCEGAVSAEEVFDKLQSGDEVAASAIDEEAKWLAHAIVAVNAVLDTEVVVITGGIGGRAVLRLRTLDWLSRLGEHTLPVVHSRLGQDAAIAGAGRLALEAAGMVSPLPPLSVDPRLPEAQVLRSSRYINDRQSNGRDRIQ